jgi:hypothetical protein
VSELARSPGPTLTQWVLVDAYASHAGIVIHEAGVMAH